MNKKLTKDNEERVPIKEAILLFKCPDSTFAYHIININIYKGKIGEERDELCFTFNSRDENIYELDKNIFSGLADLFKMKKDNFMKTLLDEKELK